MATEREKAINEWLGTHCRTCIENLDRGTEFVNCQAECEVQKDVCVTCIYYEEAYDIEPQMTELVIKIPSEEYKNICLMSKDGIGMALYDWIANGKPLPKGHGDLVTKEQMIELVEFYQINPQHFDFVNLIDDIKDEKPIIAADTGKENNNDK